MLDSDEVLTKIDAIVEVGSDDLAINNPVVDGKAAQFKVSGGFPGKEYKLRVTSTTSKGSSKQEFIPIRIKQRERSVHDESSRLTRFIERLKKFGEQLDRLVPKFRIQVFTPQSDEETLSRHKRYLQDERDNRIPDKHEDVEKWIGRMCAYLEHAFKASVVRRFRKSLAESEGDSLRSRAKYATQGLINSLATRHLRRD